MPTPSAHAQGIKLAEELLRRHLSRPSYRPQIIALGANTDCYQPLEASLRLTRGCLEVCAEFRNPVGIITKSPIIERDIERAIPDREDEIILYCGGGFRSALAADTLAKMGYVNVVSMDGGWKRWRDLGFPVESASGS